MRHRTENIGQLNYGLDMSNPVADPELGELIDAYAKAVVEFNFATLPLIVNLTAQVRPSAAEITREENARAAVVEARGKAWAYQDERGS